jgi:hypothetical protein
VGNLPGTFVTQFYIKRSASICGIHSPFDMHPASRFRLRLLRDILRIFILPAVPFTIALNASRTHLGYLTLPCYMVFISLVSFVVITYSDHVQAREAHRLGARLVPRVVSKWPGNLDILLRIMSERNSGYMQDVYMNLFHEYKSTTLNLRILWADKVRKFFISFYYFHYLFCSVSVGL